MKSLFMHLKYNKTRTLNCLWIKVILLFIMPAKFKIQVSIE
jgi:hypothetical protein